MTQEFELDVIERIAALEQQIEMMRQPEVPLRDIGCRVYNSGNIVCGTGAWTYLTFDSERYDTDGMHSTIANTGRIYPAHKGVYLITGHVQLDVIGSGVIAALAIQYFPGYLQIASQYMESGTVNKTDISVSTAYALNVGDWVALQVYHNAGGNRNALVTGNKSPEFTATRLFRNF